VTGADRAAWLHNLTTNEVKNLQAGEGNYAYALNVKGRILFDLNVVAGADAIWVDLDRRYLDAARKHFEKYTIMEDVAITDRTDEVGRIGVVGPEVSGALTEIGMWPVSAMSSLGTATVTWSGSALTLVRHDFCGVLGVEIVAEPSVAVALWNFLTSAERPTPATAVGRDAVNVHRIEAGIPWAPHEINDEVLPAETSQLERAVSFHKGCYLGQEVVERMRSRGVVARKLCGVVIEGETLPEPGSELRDESGQTVGGLTSVCRSIALDAPIALAYVRTGSHAPGTRLAVHSGETSLAAVTSVLPFAAVSGP
jgi:aminomethyltransferase